jgi:drug/metabolite transporter (DMT)-like permease
VAVAGVLAVLTGVLLISTGGGRRARGSTRTAVCWGVGTGIAIAAYTLWDNRSVTALHVPPLPYFVLGLVLQLPAMTVVLGRRRALLPQVWREARWQVLVVATLSPVAYVLVLRAQQLAPVSLVAPARESSIMVGALLSWLVLGEPNPGRRLVGSAVVLAGIAAIVLG